MTLQHSPAPNVPTPGRPCASPSPHAQGHFDRKVGRPRGLRQSPEWCAAMGERSRRLWADPAWRAWMLSRLAARPKPPRVTPSPEVIAARRKRKNLYQKMRVAGLSRAEILEELGE